MKIGWRAAALAACAVWVFSAHGAPATDPVFEVVSIREVPRNAPVPLREPDFSSVMPGGQYVDSRAWLPSMIVFAFNIPSSRQLKRLPRWAEEGLYSVAARPAPGLPLLAPEQNREQVRAMMRDMLANRFRLKVHTEDRDERILRLGVDRGGLKLKSVAPPVEPGEKEGHVYIAFGATGGRLIATKATMAGMAAALTTMLHREVRDETGLTGYYTFDQKWTAPELADGGPVSSGLGDDGGTALMAAVKDLFGLRLTGGTAPVKYWVVDSIDHPTAN